MPGTSQKFEMKNLDGALHRHVSPIRRLLNEYSLKDILSMVHGSVSEELKNEFRGLTEKDWEFVLCSVGFSRITSIQVNHSFSINEINFLIESLSFCYRQKNDGILSSKDLPETYDEARFWLRNAESVLRIKKIR